LDLATKKYLIEKEGCSLSVKDQCGLLSLNRSSYYYQPKIHTLEPELIKALEEIYVKQPFYGYRRTSLALKSKGFPIGKKKTRQLKQQLNFKTFYPGMKTTIPGKGHLKYPYLLKGVKIERPNKVWSADITYLPMGRSHVYLVGIIDWYSRKILSYRISNTLDKSFCLAALEDATLKYGNPDIFNTDQGCQFTSHEFTDRLKQAGIDISMDGKGRALDNIAIERFFRTLKYEDYYLKNYSTVGEVKAGIKEYIHFYNTERFHSALGYLAPDQVYFPKLSGLPDTGLASIQIISGYKVSSEPKPQTSEESQWVA